MPNRDLKTLKDNLPKICKDELRDLRKQLREDPHSEPEPTAWRFDQMTPEERYAIADILNL